MKKYDENTAEPVVIRLAETDSTNNYLRDLLAKERLPEGSVIATDFQSAGRGQVGNSWESERGQNLTFSVVVYPTSIPVRDQFLLSQVAALSVRDTFATYIDEVSVKWPNDIYHGDRKICGILIEHSLCGNSIRHTIIGAGININQDVFLSDAPNPVSLKQIIGRETDLDAALRDVCSRIEAQVAELGTADGATRLHSRYLATLYRHDGCMHEFALPDGGGHFMARIAGVAPAGTLTLEHADGSCHDYAFKEVQFVI